MSDNWAKDISEMHHKFGVKKWVQAQQQSDVDNSMLNEFLKFRMKMIQEEVDETNQAIENKNETDIFSERMQRLAGIKKENN